MTTPAAKMPPADVVLLVRANYMNLLPYVRWDRLTRDGQWASVYGWIDRPDGRSDFVLLVFEGPILDSWTTSSAIYSRQIGAALCGPSSGHNDCERVDDVFGSLVPRRVA